MGVIRFCFGFTCIYRSLFLSVILLFLVFPAQRHDDEPAFYFAPFSWRFSFFFPSISARTGPVPMCCLDVLRVIITPPTFFIGHLTLIFRFRFVSQGRYSEGQAARIMAEVAEAVGFLHRKGIVHFDLVRAPSFSNFRFRKSKPCTRV